MNIPHNLTLSKFFNFNIKFTDSGLKKVFNTLLDGINNAETDKLKDIYKNILNKVKTERSLNIRDFFKIANIFYDGVIEDLDEFLNLYKLANFKPN